MLAWMLVLLQMKCTTPYPDPDPDPDADDLTSHWHTGDAVPAVGARI